MIAVHSAGSSEGHCSEACSEVRVPEGNHGSSVYNSVFMCDMPRKYGNVIAEHDMGAIVNW
jgi:hypothetical protein